MKIPYRNWQITNSTVWQKYIQVLASSFIVVEALGKWQPLQRFQSGVKKRESRCHDFLRTVTPQASLLSNRSEISPLLCQRFLWYSNQIMDIKVLQIHIKSHTNWRVVFPIVNKSLDAEQKVNLYKYEIIHSGSLECNHSPIRLIPQARTLSGTS